jgi:hypothetical protein
LRFELHKVLRLTHRLPLEYLRVYKNITAKEGLTVRADQNRVPNRMGFCAKELLDLKSIQEVPARLLRRHASFAMYDIRNSFRTVLRFQGPCMQRALPRLPRCLEHHLRRRSSRVPVALFLNANPTANQAAVKSMPINTANPGQIQGNLNGSPNLLLYTAVPGNSDPIGGGGPLIPNPPSWAKVFAAIDEMLLLQ